VVILVYLGCDRAKLLQIGFFAARHEGTGAVDGQSCFRAAHASDALMMVRSLTSSSVAQILLIMALSAMKGVVPLFATSRSHASK
jgi:hypothetical protein